MPSQFAISCAFTQALSDLGCSHLNVRQMNAVLKAAADVSAELRRPTVLATPGMGLEAWLQSDDSGASSMFMAAVAFPGRGILSPEALATRNHPLDPADFGRCFRFLEACPDARNSLPAIAEIGGPVWERLICAWDELSDLYRAAQATGAEQAPALQDRIQTLITPTNTQNG